METINRHKIYMDAFNFNLARIPRILHDGKNQFRASDYIAAEKDANKIAEVLVSVQDHRPKDSRSTLWETFECWCEFPEEQEVKNKLLQTVGHRPYCQRLEQRWYFESVDQLAVSELDWLFALERAIAPKKVVLTQQQRDLFSKDTKPLELVEDDQRLSTMDILVNVLKFYTDAKVQAHCNGMTDHEEYFSTRELFWTFLLDYAAPQGDRTDDIPNPDTEEVPYDEYLAYGHDLIKEAVRRLPALACIASTDFKWFCMLDTTCGILWHLPPKRITNGVKWNKKHIDSRFYHLAHSVEHDCQLTEDQRWCPTHKTILEIMNNIAPGKCGKCRQKILA